MAVECNGQTPFSQNEHRLIDFIQVGPLVDRPGRLHLNSSSLRLLLIVAKSREGRRLGLYQHGVPLPRLFAERLTLTFRSAALVYWNTCTGAKTSECSPSWPSGQVCFKYRLAEYLLTEICHAIRLFSRRPKHCRRRSPAIYPASGRPGTGTL